MFAALVVLGRAVAWVNFYPALIWKAALGWKGNIRANPFLYADGAGDAVLLVEDGATGAYNRSNRSLHHLVENMAVVVAALGPCARIAPRPTFLLVCAWSLGRVLHQLGYAVRYGKHAAGFVLSTVAALGIEGICAIVALQGFGVAVLPGQHN